MKKNSIIFLFFTGMSCLTIISSCKEPIINDCYTDAGQITCEYRQTGEFSRVIINGDFQINIQQSDSCYVKVIGGSNLIGGMITFVDSSTLIIEDQIRCKWIRSYDQLNTIWIYVKKLNNLDFRGSGNMNSVGTITGNFPLVIETHDGSGNIDLTLDYQELFLYQHVSTGNIKISGRCNTLQLYTASLGLVDCAELISYKVIIQHIGSNMVYIYPEYFLDAILEGSGNVYYRGNPLIKMRIMGGGRLIQAN